ncbi:MAG: thioredoxin domain-containing protein [Pseudomonadota bacterium]
MRFSYLGGVALLLVACGGNAESPAGDGEASSASTEVTETEVAETEATETAETTTNAEAVASAELEEGPRVVPAPAGSKAGDPLILGDPDAPLHLIEYASLTCPACAQFHKAVMPVIQEQYIDTGKVKFEFREFPTQPQNLAYAGFYLARCAATTKGVSAHSKMLSTLFSRQSEWVYGSNPGPVLQNIAAQVGIDKDGLQDCFFREDIKQAVSDNIELGVSKHEVTGTPTLILNDEKLVWRGTVESITNALDAALADAG